MTDSERAEVGLAVAGMAEIFSKQLSAPGLALYLDALNGYQPEVLLMAIRDQIKNRKSEQGFPSPGDIAECVNGQPQFRQAPRDWNPEVLERLKRK